MQKALARGGFEQKFRKSLFGVSFDSSLIKKSLLSAIAAGGLILAEGADENYKSANNLNPQASIRRVYDVGRGRDIYSDSDYFKRYLENSGDLFASSKMAPLLWQSDYAEWSLKYSDSDLPRFTNNLKEAYALRLEQTPIYVPNFISHKDYLEISKDRIRDLQNVPGKERLLDILKKQVNTIEWLDLQFERDYNLLFNLLQPGQFTEHRAK